MLSMSHLTNPPGCEVGIDYLHHVDQRLASYLAIRAAKKKSIFPKEVIREDVMSYSIALLWPVRK